MSAAEQAERLQRAQREALNAAKLRDHPNIVTVHDVVVENDAPWIVMQLVSGSSLQAHIKAHGPLSVDTAANAAVALLKALATARKAGIVHRDVKPANVMMAADGEVLLTDFGIAVNRTEPGRTDPGLTDSGLTDSGAVIGSAGYISPERARGEKGQAPGDLFSLGATLYEAVEGVSPFLRETRPDRFTRSRTTRPRRRGARDGSRH
ncbi:serine/threonine-protein kinase [Streptomyces inhibens]|uniref:serine/threonine-protein kinase n=1 Tax=Streptomyces inhibens TaxID=2293571 RepID=UPI0037A30A52